uniref:THD domain-containing protein n=1 Tax=Monopterus albus TaxID=43700 RepID=A0A3Q3IMA0_MONAL
MSYDQSYPFPQVFLVDEGGGPQMSSQPPNLVPCWSFPPAQERMRKREKNWMGVSPSVALIVLLLFLLVFAALGFEAYQIHNMQKQLRDMRQVRSHCLSERGLNEEDNRPAAHVIGRIETMPFPPTIKTLRWEPSAGRAFVSGGVTYKAEDGALQVNETGLYHIYSRVELILKNCNPTSEFVHWVFVRRTGQTSPLPLMEAHRAGFCTQQPGHSWTTESYLGSALKLRKFDRVFVNVSHPNFLSHTHYANFFGLYKI